MLVLNACTVLACALTVVFGCYGLANSYKTDDRIIATVFLVLGLLGIVGAVL